MYLLLQRPTFIRYSLNSLTQWQVIGSFKLTEYPYEIKLLNIMLSVSIFPALSHTAAHPLLSPPKFYSLSSPWTGFLRIFFFFRDLVPIRKCVRQNNWIIFLFASEGRERRRKIQRAVICSSVRKGRIIWGSLGCVTHLLFECKKEKRRRKRDIFNLYLDWKCVQSNLQQQLEGSHVFNVSSHLIQTTPYWQWFTRPHYMLYGYKSTSFTLSRSYYSLSYMTVNRLYLGCYFYYPSVSICPCSRHFDFS